MKKIAIGLVVAASAAMFSAQPAGAHGFGGESGGGGGGDNSRDSRDDSRGGGGESSRGGGGGESSRGGGGIGTAHAGGIGGSHDGGGERESYRGGGGGETPHGGGGHTGDGGEVHTGRSGEVHSGGAHGGKSHGGKNAKSHGKHAGLPTDGGFGRAEGAGRSANVPHQTMAVSASVAAARAAAVRNHFPRREVFQRDWYLHHPHGWNPRQWAPGRAWAWATWPDVELWFGWGNDLPPAYYDYGNMVYYQGDEVYYGTQPVATAAEYYRQAAALAASGAAIDPNAGPWMPLGVFAFVLGDASDTSRAFQLAVNRSGTIAGNYYDALTGIALPVQGAADRTSQRAAWTVGDNKITVYETGISNLTRNQAPALVHFGAERTQQWMLVRLPAEAASAGR
ncbi:MAG: hypothetical protein ACLQLG_03865 [Thermoguttaceae bacterium]